MDKQKITNLTLDEIDDEILDLSDEELDEENLRDSVFDEDDDDSIILSTDELSEVTEENPEDFQFAEGVSDAKDINEDELDSFEDHSDLFDENDEEIEGPALNDDSPSESSDESLDSGFQFSNLNRSEVKKLMKYLDELLGSVPEEFVAEFANSEYFELYKKAMDELE